jgi:hypothetical protein
MDVPVGESGCYGSTEQRRGEQVEVAASVPLEVAAAGTRKKRKR